MVWTIPDEWAGERAFILGGGPSLKGFDAEVLRGHGRVVGINEAGLTLAPWCDVLHWCDGRWLEWNVDRVGLHCGSYKICRHSRDGRTPNCPPDVSERIPSVLDAFEVRHIEKFGNVPLSQDPTKTSGVCAGGSAINLAFLFGAVSIVLLGFDMQPTGQWHEQHRVPSKPFHYQQHKVPAIERMARPLRSLGIEVLNATPGSALECFPIVKLEDIL